MFRRAGYWRPARLLWLQSAPGAVSSCPALVGAWDWSPGCGFPGPQVQEMWAGAAQARQARQWRGREVRWEQGSLPRPLSPGTVTPPGRAQGFCRQETELSPCVEVRGLQDIMVVMNGNGRTNRGSLSH